MLEKTIIVDVDGVLLNYHDMFIEEYSNHFSYHENPQCLTDEFDSTVLDGLITLFSQTTKFSNLEPFKKSDVYLKKLYNDGFTINVITACGNSGLTRELRLKNLEKVFGDIFNDITFVGLGDSKIDYLKTFKGSNLVYVEDKFEHYLDGETVGLDSIMMATNYNHGLDTKRMEDWSEIYQYIIDKH